MKTSPFIDKKKVDRSYRLCFFFFFSMEQISFTVSCVSHQGYTGSRQTGLSVVYVCVFVGNMLEEADMNVMWRGVSM